MIAFAAVADVIGHKPERSFLLLDQLGERVGQQQLDLGLERNQLARARSAGS